MFGLARLFILVGLLLVLVGLVLAAAVRLHLPLGRLPGDLSYRGRNWSISFPLATSLLLSVLLSLLLWLVNRFWR
jgi:Protein of unknown function (DUF2905)